MSATRSGFLLSLRWAEIRLHWIATMGEFVPKVSGGGDIADGNAVSADECLRVVQFRIEAAGFWDNTPAPEACQETVKN
jgi:hypothetical protein